jgi:hypothetical protein
MHKRVILDSGAFSVWTKGITIDLDAYIAFCRKHPYISYYVNLDVIPGKPNDAHSLRFGAIDKACEQGWENYVHMTKRMPLQKVIPVFHQGESLRWLKRYVDYGCSYIGISPANDRTTHDKIQWLKEVRKEIGDKEGNPIVRTHGFAVTSLRLMKFWKWHSVDSASWRRTAAYGNIWVPFLCKGQYDYTRSPIVLAISLQSPDRGRHNQHLDSCSPIIRKYILKYIQDELRLSLGVNSIFQADASYQLRDDEFWKDKKKREAFRIKKLGLTNDFGMRGLALISYIQRMELKVPVRHIYFAGASTGSPSNRYRINNRLFSYNELGLHPITTSIDEFAWYEKQLQCQKGIDT